jgi:hypothetical protein
LRDPQTDDNDYPERIVKGLDAFALSLVTAHDERGQAITSSLYGLILGAGYSLCESYHRLVPQPAPFSASAEYFEKVRLQLHRHLPAVALRGDAQAFATELVGFHINTAQHFIHFLLDRLLNVLLTSAFDRSEQEMGFVFYNFVGMRVSLLRWRLADDPELGGRFEALDGAFSRWSKSYQAGNCNGFLEKILRNPEVKPPPDSLCSLEDGVRFTLGSDAGDIAGALAYIIDRTNEAKHLPGGTGRAHLAMKLKSPAELRRLYEVEWVVTFVAFEQVLGLLGASLCHLHDVGSGPA